MKYLPFFVYGTLLPGQPNHDLWSGSIIHQEPATFPNGRLFDLGAYPMLLEGDGGPVAGLVVTISQQNYHAVLSGLDDLEGYDPQEPESRDYWRFERLVLLAGSKTQAAWVYLGNEATKGRSTLIESGDWVSHMAPNKQEILNWWSQYRFGKME